ncbi:hypothetical protein H5154_08200 [Pseudoalteromonas sp. SR44-5]|uniref:DUF6985 domain-containing protein n=1 Tax=Pseudoalteromonas TaxID=53246 RepID=UPI0016009320|nr:MULTISPECIES: hypothetical protein [unclassified Pseudoalteromonas]MBB1342497.1 hypothetical protein [Pseudoalteromonas sp. SR45-6]MBB1366362.1 hypothetical protein [Pseudoalteromonas sp. SR44-5]MBB1434753.1 hypothetical protein [Pseudoalteromonas sp. SG43-6]MBB1480915.1 hypothetical protein [Pseudoalteromonas sp. SG41-2]
MKLAIGNIVFTKVKSEYDEDWYDWLSSELSIPFLNNSKLQIRLDFNDQELDEFKSELEKTLNNTLALDKDDREYLKEHLFAYYRDFVLDVGEECLEDMPAQENEDDIFEFVHISSLSISRSSITEEFFCQFTGGCDWEIEHGISISFKDGKNLAKVGGCGHINNSDAYADKSMDKYIYYGNIVKTYAAE